MQTMIIPGATNEAERISSMRIPAARVPTEPTEAEIATCEARLRLTEMRDQATVRPGRRVAR